MSERPNGGASPPGRLRRFDVDWDSAFARLALTHALSVSGETMVVLSLAGSFFFKVDPAQGRGKVIAGLLFTMAPFALVGPFIGPVIDRVRGGHRAVIRGSMALRVVVAITMLIAVTNDSIALFPEAFAMLVLAKTYQIAKAAVVPTTVAGDLELVEANSKLQLLSGLAAIVAGAFGGLLMLIGPEWLLGGTALVFGAATVASMGLHPSTLGAEEETDVAQRAGTPAAPTSASTSAPTSVRTSGPSVGDGLDPPPTAASGACGDLDVSTFAMSILRAVVGLLTFLLAFELRGGSTATPLATIVHWTLVVYHRLDVTTVVPPVVEGPPKWYFGAVIAASVAGGLAGSAFAPIARRRFTEERILLAACGVALVAGVAGVLISGLGSYVLMAGGVAIAAALGKQAFDAIVQRDVDEVERGQVFARCEARFQITWVLGALVPAVVHLPITVGAVLIALLSLGAGVALVTGSRLVLVHRVPGSRRLGRPYVSRSGKSGISGSPSSSGNG